MPKIGVPTSGVMDQIDDPANKLVGNPISNPVIENTSMSIYRFNDPTLLSIYGAKCRQINGKSVPQ